MTRLEPLKFLPSLREKVWGSTDLRSVMAVTADSRIGEAWSPHSGSEVAEGPLQGRTADSLLAEYGNRIMGPAWRQRAAAGDRTLPITCKLLFASEYLSIQVHPDDRRARSIGARSGKTELWYVLEANERGRLGMGLESALDSAALARAAADGSIRNEMRWLPARAGDCVMVPAGTVHCVGGGVVLCEVQQNSDVTHRLFDYERPGPNGKPRALDIPNAVAAADVGSRPEPGRPRPLRDGPCRVRKLGQCRHFAAEVLAWDSPFIYTPDRRRGQILLILRGCGSVNQLAFEAGDSFLIPSEAARFPVDGVGAEAVRAYVP